MNLDTIKLIGELVLLGLGALSAALHVVAPFTKTTKDDTVRNWADKVSDKLKAVIVPRKVNATTKSLTLPVRK